MGDSYKKGLKDGRLLEGDKWKKEIKIIKDENQKLKKELNEITERLKLRIFNELYS